MNRNGRTHGSKAAASCAHSKRFATNRRGFGSKRCFLLSAFCFFVAVLANPCVGFADAITNKEVAKPDRWFQYTNDVIDNVPWSIHIVKLERSSHGFEFVTTSGQGKVLGMGIVSEQIKTVPHELGQPVAAINGDFYDKSEVYQGKPRDLQIRRGEVLSSPAGHTCFWMERDDTPRMTNVFSRFQVTWPDGTKMNIGLNETRENEKAVLYTAAVGTSTRTTGGTELILENAGDASCFPLRIGQVYSVRVREVRHTGNTALSPNTLVLSLGPDLAAKITSANVRSGAMLRISTETFPALSGVEIAIGGGPLLVSNGKAMQWHGFIHMRHPRTAFGWNKDYFFLVEVDGRQSNISLGMTFPELADYLVRLGCEEAMNLDGGGSATLWALGSVRNSPSEGDERPSANALAVVRKRPAQK